MTNEEICAVFARNLNNLMARENLKQRDIVERLGISKAQVSDWCAGNNVPRTDSLGALMELFDCKLSDLLVDHNEASASKEGGRSKIQAIFDQLSPANQTKLLELAALYLAAQHKTEETL